jgi:hypothetical protein
MGEQKKVALAAPTHTSSRQTEAETRIVECVQCWSSNRSNGRCRAKSTKPSDVRAVSKVWLTLLITKFFHIVCEASLANQPTESTSVNKGRKVNKASDNNSGLSTVQKRNIRFFFERRNTATD